MGALTPWFTTLPKWSIRQTMTEYDRNSRKISPSDTGKVICDDSFLLIYASKQIDKQAQGVGYSAPALFD